MTAIAYASQEHEPSETIRPFQLRIWQVSTLHTNALLAGLELSRPEHAFFIGLGGGRAWTTTCPSGGNQAQCKLTKHDTSYLLTGGFANGLMLPQLRKLPFQSYTMGFLGVNVAHTARIRHIRLTVGVGEEIHRGPFAVTGIVQAVPGERVIWRGYLGFAFAISVYTDLDDR